MSLANLWDWEGFSMWSCVPYVPQYLMTVVQIQPSYNSIDNIRLTPGINVTQEISQEQCVFLSAAMLCYC